MKSLIVTIIMLIITISLVIAFPLTIDQQGILKNATDGSLMTGTYEFNITLYNSSNDAAVYSENRSVAVVDGVWNYIIGEVTAINPILFKDDDLYAKSKISSDVLNRINLTAVPYAFYGLNCNDSTWLGGIAEAGTNNVSFDDGLLYINTSANRVGIGTTAPNGKLHVVGDLWVDDDFYLGGSILMVNTTTIVANGSLIPFTDNKFNLSNSTNRYANLWLSNDAYVAGDVGIGTTAPNGKLHVVGDLWVDDDLYLGGSIFEVNATNIAGNGSFVPVVDNKFNLSNSSHRFANLWLANNAYINGNVGIGTTTPSAKLQVVGTTGSPVFNFTNGSMGMYMDKSGNVGIGTTAPNAKLDILGREINIGGDLNYWKTRTDATTKTGYITTPHYTNAEENVLIYYSNNYASGNHLLIGGGSVIYNPVTTLIFYTGATSTTLIGSERMRINSAGKIGIGTTTPNSTLSINKSIEVFNETDENDLFFKINQSTGNMTLYDSNGAAWYCGVSTSGTLSCSN